MVKQVSLRECNVYRPLTDSNSPKALVDMANGTPREKLLLRATYACIFLGVPNRGLNIEQLTTMVKGQRNEKLVSDLGVGSQRLRALHDTFCQIFNFDASRIISVYETKLSKTVQVKIHPRMGRLVHVLICSCRSL